jgi:ABC-type nitrate/sulfonate/bicarbonate transport system substrate-binding protein
VKDSKSKLRFRRLQRRKAYLAMLSTLPLGALLTACGTTTSTANNSPSNTRTIVVAAPECAHCLAMSLLGHELPKTYKADFTPAASPEAVATALVAGRVTVGQVDYPSLVSFISEGLPVLAISGEVNGGSDLVLAPSLHIAPNNWTALTSYILAQHASGHTFTIASQFGTVQDIDLRLELAEKGINPNTDVNIVNVPFQAMGSALKDGNAEAAVPVQPFGSELTSEGLAHHFSYLFHQPVGNLTNVVIVTKTFAEEHPHELDAIIRAMAGLVSYLKTKSGKIAWGNAIEHYTQVPPKVVNKVLDQLVPQLSIPFNQVVAIASAMYNRGLISKPVTSQELTSDIDYKALENATGLQASEVGAP